MRIQYKYIGNIKRSITNISTRVYCPVTRHLYLSLKVKLSFFSSFIILYHFIIVFGKERVFSSFIFIYYYYFFGLYASVQFARYSPSRSGRENHSYGELSRLGVSRTILLSKNKRDE
jgi:hypothetical protein